MPIPTILVRGLQHRFGADVLALDGVDMELSAGELVGLIGPNGAGKSTLLALVAGHLQPTAGEVSVLGQFPHDSSGGAPGDLRRRLRWVEQRISLDPEMTGREILRLFVRLYGVARSRGGAGIVGPLLDRYGLSEHADRRVASYSGGLERRLHVALGVLGQPEVILLDEPTAGLDEQARELVWGELRAECERGGTVVVSSHDLAKVERHCQRVIVLHRGRLLADGAPEELVTAHAEPAIALKLEDPTRARGVLAELDGVDSVSTGGGGWLVAKGPELSLQRVVRALSEANVSPCAVEERSPNLAAAYLALTDDAPMGLRGARARGQGRGRGGRRRA